MAQAQNGATVKIHCTGKLEDIGVFCSSSNRGPMQFKPGEGRVIPGFEEAVVGMGPCKSKSITNPTGKGIRTES